MQISQERAQALIAAVQNAPSPRSLIADVKRSHDDHAATLDPLGVITRIPNPMGAVAQVIGQALTADIWPPLDETTRSQRLGWCHDGIAQRGLVVPSQAALERAAATGTSVRQRDEAAIAPPLFPLQAQCCETSEMAQEALAEWARRWTYYQVESYHLIEPKRDARKGRPTPHTPLKASAGPIQAPPARSGGAGAPDARQRLRWPWNHH